MTIAIGKITIRRREITYNKLKTNDVTAEIDRYNAAIRLAGAFFTKKKEESIIKNDKNGELLYNVYKLITEDEQYISMAIKQITNDHVTAEYALAKSSKMLADSFSKMKDPYMKDRSKDIMYVATVILAGLEKDKTKLNERLEFEEDTILATDMISPSELNMLGNVKVKGVILINTGKYSHIALQLRNKGIPCVYIDELSDEIKDACINDEIVVIDTEDNKVYSSLTQEEYNDFNNKYKQQLDRINQLSLYKDYQVIYNDKKIDMYINISSVDDIFDVKNIGCDGIGLFRTEYQYMGRKEPPTQEELYEDYIKVTSVMPNKSITIRTFEIDEDKPIEYIQGRLKGISLYKKYEKEFRKQLQAIIKASRYGNISVMFPMICEVGGYEWAYNIYEQEVNSLKEQKIISYITNVGIMIETPASLFIIEKLCDMCDFLSIGTNDLMQYLFCVSRFSNDVFSTEQYEIMLDIIKRICGIAHAKGKKVSICGEMASDTRFSKKLLACGIDALSLRSSAVLEVKKELVTK